MQFEKIVEGLWSVHHVVKNGFELRMMIARLDDGTTLVSSPLPGMKDAHHAELLAIGTPSVILASNHFHNLGLADFIERYPDAQVICAAGAKTRLEKKTPFTFGGLDGVALPSWLSLVEPPGLKGGETWLVARRDGACVWAVCDAIFNLPRHPSGAFGLITRLGGSATGLRISRLFKIGLLGDKAAYREWLLEQIESAPPTVLLPAHGTAWDVDTAVLTDLVRRRLG